MFLGNKSILKRKKGQVRNFKRNKKKDNSFYIEIFVQNSNLKHIFRLQNYFQILYLITLTCSNVIFYAHNCL